MKRASAPPDGLPIYRLLTGVDDAAFCRRVSEALALGYELYGSPAVTYDGRHVIAAQALRWPGAGVAHAVRAPRTRDADAGTHASSDRGGRATRSSRTRGRSAK